MRLYFLTFFGSILFATLATSQSDSTFSMEVSKTEVRVGEAFEVKFVLEGNKSGKFITPDWASAGFVVLNTSQSSSFSINNGASTSSATYKYQLMARDTGLIELPVGVAMVGGEEKRTPTHTIHVLPGSKGEGEELWNGNRSTPTPPAQDPKKKIKTIRL